VRVDDRVVEGLEGVAEEEAHEEVAAWSENPSELLNGRQTTLGSWWMREYQARTPPYVSGGSSKASMLPSVTGTSG
jgi:hypothetical protein